MDQKGIGAGINMFRGTTAVNLDSKGRLTIPTRYRDLLRQQCQGQMVCTLDMSLPCLLLYTLPQWQLVEEKLNLLSDFRNDERLIKRLLLGNAKDCEMDRNGRVLLPTPLRGLANLDKKLMMVGQMNKFELWDESTWMAQMQQDMQAAQSIDFDTSERLRDLAL